MSDVWHLLAWAGIQLLGVWMAYSALGALTDKPKGKRLDAAVSACGAVYVTVMAVELARAWFVGIP